MTHSNFTPQEISLYQQYFSENAFWSKVKGLAKKAGSKILYLAFILYYTATSKTIATPQRALLFGALGYLILPVDLIPDFVPAVGLTDDLAALSIAYKIVKENVTPDIEDKAKTQLQRLVLAKA